MSRTCLALQHLSFEDLGSIEPVLRTMGFTIQYRQAGVDDLHSAQAQAEWRDADLVVVLGGPIGVYEADRYPFIHDELARIKERLDSGNPLISSRNSVPPFASRRKPDVSATAPVKAPLE